MTPYQRGYRDAALSLAKQFDAVICEEETLLQRCQEEAATAHPENAASLATLAGQVRHRLRTAQKCYCLALFAAAMPADPEAP